MTKHFKIKVNNRETYYQTKDSKVTLHFFIDYSSKNKALITYGELNSTSLHSVDFPNENLVSPDEFEEAMKKLFNHMFRKMTIPNYIIVDRRHVDKKIELQYGYSEDTPSITFR